MTGPVEIDNGKYTLWGLDDRDTFIRWMRRRGATLSHSSGRTQSVAKRRSGRTVHLTFGDRPEDFGQVWITTIADDGSLMECRWINGDIKTWFREFGEDLP